MVTFMGYSVSLPLLIGILAAAIAMVTDMWTGKIPNWLTFPAMVVGFLMSFFFNGIQGLGYSVAACIIGQALYLGFAMFGIIGMGDVKLMGALGALGGTYFVLTVFLYTSLLGIPHALIVQFLNYGIQGFTLLVARFMSGAFRHQTIHDENKNPEARFKFFLGIDILLATVLAVVFPLFL